MSIIITYPFTTPANYTLSNAAVSGGTGKLGFEDVAGLTFQQDFSSSTGFTYNAAKTDFSAGTMVSKAQNPYLSVIGATYTSTLNANWNIAGSTTASIVGSPSLSGGKAVMTSTESIKYVLTSRNDGNGCLRFRYTPNYSGPPAVFSYDIIGFNPDNGTNNGRFDVFHQVGTGQIKVTVYNSAGTSVYVNQTIGGVWSPTSGVEYEIEFNWDYSTGDIRMFIDGALHGLLNSAGAWTHTGAANVTIFVGANARNVNLTNASYNDVVFFDGVKHTAPYSAGYTLPETLYETDTITLPTFTYSQVGDIQSFTGLTGTVTGSPRFIVNDKYWDGAAWSTSDGSYAQASSLALTNTNLPTLTPADTVVVKIVTTSSNTQDVLDLITLTYTGQHYKSSGYIEPIAPLQVEEIVSFSHSIIVPANTTLGVVLKIDGVLKYWDGAAWSTSDGTYAQSNTATQINDNLSSLSFGVNSSVFFRWIFNTSDDQVTPEVDTSSISYDFGGVEIDAGTCVVFGYVKDIRNVGLYGVTVTFQLNTPNNIYSEASNNIIDSGAVSVKTDSYGYFEIDLIKSSEYEGSRTYKVTLTYKDKTVSKTSAGNLLITVPDADSKDITDLLTAI